MNTFVLSLIIPVYKNEEGLHELISALVQLSNQCTRQYATELEVAFVVDGSPDESIRVLRSGLVAVPFRSQLIAHSRNFGAFSAVRTGLAHGRGNMFAVMAADLQEPPELILSFVDILLKDSADIAVGTRTNRSDASTTVLAANLFWHLYRKFVIKELPKGGVDIFGCNKLFRDQLLKLEESHSSLIALIYWLGFRRIEVPYERKARTIGKSAWTIKKKINYFMDSLFAFTDLPIKLLMVFGILGMLISLCLGTIVLIGKIMGWIEVAGYSGTILIALFFGGLNSLGLGIVGTYTWRTYENTKKRPHSVVLSHEFFDAK